MGACHYSKVWKNCSTCGHWQGPRQVNKTKDTVTVDSSVVGICQGFWQGSRKFGNNKCTEWKLWPELTGDAPEAAVYP